MHQPLLLLLLGERCPCGVFRLPFGNQLADRLCFLQGGVVVRVEHLNERPLCPTVERGVAGFDFAVPVVAETYLAQLLHVVGDICHRGLFGVLPRLDGILLGGQTIRVEAHRVEHVEALQTLVATVDITGDIAERMPHMQSRPARVGEHIQHIVVRLGAVVADLINTFFFPLRLPLAFNLCKIVVHIFRVNYYSVLSPLRESFVLH